MKNLDNWAKDKPIHIAIIAQQIAVSSEPCFKALKALKAGKPIEGYKQPPKIKEWLGFYKNHRKINEYLKRTLVGFGELAEIGDFFSDLLNLGRKERRRLGSKRFNNKLRKEIENLSQENWNEIQEFWKEIYQISLEDIKSDITGEYDEELERNIKRSINDPEMIFFVRVWVPCWILYGKFPSKILKTARSGKTEKKIEALEKLIRLDGSVINDPKIAEYLHQEKARENKSTYNLLMKATRQGPKAKITIKKIKINFAGLISSISSALGYRLSEPEIRDLFDAIARDTGKGEIDTDIPDSPEAFAKAIQRERQFWNIFPQPDKK